MIKIAISNAKKIAMIFFRLEMNPPPPFGSFPKIHQFCQIQASLTFSTDTLTNQVAVYTAGVSQLEWREVESGKLPSPRGGLRAAMVDNVLYVTGGEDGHMYLTPILSWDSTNESWEEAGNLVVARSYHAAVAVPSSLIESGCSPTT